MTDRIRHWWNRNKEQRERLAEIAEAESIALLKDVMENAGAGFDVQREFLTKAALRQVANGGKL